jgi:hypothetical protein
MIVGNSVEFIHMVFKASLKLVSIPLVRFTHMPRYGVRFTEIPFAGVISSFITDARRYKLKTSQTILHLEIRFSFILWQVDDSTE